MSDLEKALARWEVRDPTVVMDADATTAILNAARRSDEVRELVGLMLAFYDVDKTRPGTNGSRIRRRENQTMALSEILRLLDGDDRTLNDLRSRSLIPLTLADLEPRLGGVVEGSQ